MSAYVLDTSALMALMAALAYTTSALAEWETKYHKDVPWDTTSDAADLDVEVATGARILKYADGSYVHAIHRQYPKSCGPACLAIVLKQLGLAQLDRRLTLPRHLDGGGGERVDVGYVGSMEHVMWLGCHRFRLEAKQWEKRAKEARFASAEGVLNTGSTRRRSSFLGPEGEMGYLSYKTIPNWLWHGPSVGTGGDRSAHFGLTGTMNYYCTGSPRVAASDHWRFPS